jgi:transposase-like protein
MLVAALKTIPITWPFAIWGIDMVGPFKRARGQLTHLLVAVDKFSKWVEAKPIRMLDAATATKFLRELILRYGYPHSIITDNGNNFRKSFSCFCKTVTSGSTLFQSPTRSLMDKLNRRTR